MADPFAEGMVPEVIGAEVETVEPEAPVPPPPAMTNEEIVESLLSYNRECEEARRSGHSPRGQVWEDNWRAFWMIDDTSNKALWQSTDRMPEAPQFVERWAAALREALVQSGEWYTIKDPLKRFGGLSKEIKKIIDYWLDRAGEAESGEPIGFMAVFEDIMKQAAIMKFSAAVTWKHRSSSVTEPSEEPGPDGEVRLRMATRERSRGYVAIEPVDSRQIWHDPKGRGLYRRRRIEMDLHEIRRLGDLTDANGNPIFNREAINRISESFVDQDEQAQRETSTGTTQSATAVGRKPCVLDEYLCTILKKDGSVGYPPNTYVVMCNQKEIIRDPEPNPFWHGRDWIVDFAVITVPLSPDGKTYMESWTPVAKTFTEMTRLILDGVFTSTMNAFVGDPMALENPSELDEGVSPNKVFQAAEGADVTKVLREIELGRLPAESIRVWEGLKQELREGAQKSEIALGQLPPKGDITATEITESQREAASTVRSIALTIEQRGLNRILDLVWQTALQHMNMREEPELLRSLGDMGELLASLTIEQRYKVMGPHYRIRANGLSSIIERGKDRNAMLALLNLVASNEILLQAFLQRFSVPKTLDRLVRLFGISVEGLELEPDETPPQLPAATEGGPEGTPEMQEILRMGGGNIANGRR